MKDNDCLAEGAALLGMISGRTKRAFWLPCITTDSAQSYFRQHATPMLFMVSVYHQAPDEAADGASTSGVPGQSVILPEDSVEGPILPPLVDPTLHFHGCLWVKAVQCASQSRLPRQSVISYEDHVGSLIFLPRVDPTSWPGHLVVCSFGRFWVELGHFSGRSAFKVTSAKLADAGAKHNGLSLSPDPSSEVLHSA